jgi:hypothetical protein
MKRFALICGLVGFLAGLVAACGETAVPSPTAMPPSPSPASTSAGRASGAVTPLTDYSLRIKRGGQLVNALKAGDIEGLPQQVPEIGGRPMNGARLRVVLALAGVQDAQEITVRGTNSTRNAPIAVTLPWSAITDDILLGVNKRGAAKFFGPNLPGEQWVVDVTEIEVK